MTNCKHQEYCLTRIRYSEFCPQVSDHCDFADEYKQMKEFVDHSQRRELEEKEAAEMAKDLGLASEFGGIR